MCFHLVGRIWEAARGAVKGKYESVRLGFAGTGAIMPEKPPKAEEKS